MVLPKWLMFTMPLSCLYSEHMKSKISITTTTTNGSKMWFLKLKAIGRREYFHQGLLYYSVCVPLYVQGTFLVNQAVGRAAAKAKLKSASIVNISSIVGKVSQFFCCCCFCCCCCCCFFCCFFFFFGGVILLPPPPFFFFFFSINNFYCCCFVLYFGCCTLRLELYL